MVGVLPIGQQPASLHKFMLYETKTRYYLVGVSRCATQWRILKIDRTSPTELDISEDPTMYTQVEVNSVLSRLAEGNRATGGLKFVAKCYGIVGFVRFLESYYMIVITKRRVLGTVCGHSIYGIDATRLFVVPHPSYQLEISKAEKRYKKLLMGVDLTKNFFYSYTYPIMRTVQSNSVGVPGDLYENMFVWNAFLTRQFRGEVKNTRWTVPLVHGYFQQTRLSVFGRVINLTLISRRSRHFAGTRYLKRGINDQGRVANDVETEQIIDEVASYRGGHCHCSSVVQNRGSIPLFWSQETSKLSPKPDIILQRYDPMYEASQLHFQDLSRRYGNPIVILNLIKTVEKHPREMVLRREFANAVSYINQVLPEEKQIKYIHFDFHKHSKGKNAAVLNALAAVVKEAFNSVNFFYSGRPDKQKPLAASSGVSTLSKSLPSTSTPGLSNWISSLASLRTTTPISPEPNQLEQKVQSLRSGMPQYQSGVLRSNCIDCLDRTNVAQFAFGVCALGYQLCALGLIETPELEAEAIIVAALMDMYQEMGDVLSQQYGGSLAHNTIFGEHRGDWTASMRSKDLVTSIRRYYSNTYTDAEKQDAINLFLGNFIPEHGKPFLWELDSDYYLHVRSFPNWSGSPPLLSPAASFDSQSGEEAAIIAEELGSPAEVAHAQAKAVVFGDVYKPGKLTSFDKLAALQTNPVAMRMYPVSLDPGPTNVAAANLIRKTSHAAHSFVRRSSYWTLHEHKEDFYDKTPRVSTDEPPGTPMVDLSVRSGQLFAPLEPAEASLHIHIPEDEYDRYAHQSQEDAWFRDNVGLDTSNETFQWYTNHAAAAADLSFVNHERGQPVDQSERLTSISGDGTPGDDTRFDYRKFCGDLSQWISGDDVRAEYSRFLTACV
eukprot:jgi/Chlat1/7203/Chrsp57S06849